jgi:hypothetical protein
MSDNTHVHRKVRINIQLTDGLKSEVETWAARNGESIAQFLRVSAQERIDRQRAQEQERLLQEGYEHLSGEHRALASSHEPVDLEGWE